MTNANWCRTAYTAHLDATAEEAAAGHVVKRVIEVVHQTQSLIWNKRSLDSAKFAANHLPEALSLIFILEELRIELIQLDAALFFLHSQLDTDAPSFSGWGPSQCTSNFRLERLFEWHGLARACTQISTDCDSFHSNAWQRAADMCDTCIFC